LAALTEAQAIVQLRRELDDNADTASTDPPPSHLAIDEPALGSVNGANTNFRVRHFPLAGTAAPFSLEVRDETYAAVSVASVNRFTGQFVTTGAPAAGKTLFCQYYYQYATDEQFRSFLQQGYRFINASSMATVPENLYPALFAFVKYLYYLMLSTKSGDFFDSTVGDQTITKSHVPRLYFDMATETKEEAFKLRDDVKLGQGDQLRPAYGFVAPRQPLYTPPQ
jgi:hypothetical protein